jgi:hypothetical protein
MGAPFARDDLVHLLSVYQAVIAARPIGSGNADYLDVLLTASRRLVRDVAALDAGDPAPARQIEALTAGQTAANARDAASRVLRLIGTPKRPRNSRSVYVPAPLAELPFPYRTVTVIFGPGIGMGDEISFRLFVKALTTRSQPRTVTVFDLYPGLWEELVPGVRAQHYRGHPLRPFASLDAKGDDPDGRSLVVIIDFDGYYLHERLGLRAPHRDVLEISLGLREAWLVRGRSHWIRAAEFRDPPVANNYWVVRHLTNALVDAAPDLPAWEPLEADRPAPAARNGEVVLLVNPFSSKDVPVDAGTWTRLVVAVRGAVHGSAIRVVVFPGTSETTHAQARAMCGRLAERGIAARVMTTPQNERITPYNAIRSLVAQLRSALYCITVDSFPAHIVPLFGVPTLVVALKDNREFWVPTKYALYVPFAQLIQQGPATLAKLGASLARPPGAITDAGRAAERVVTSTHGALALTTSAAVEEISRALFDYLALSPDPPEVRRELHRWFRFLSRFGGALAAEPLTDGVATSFVRRWSASEAYKYVALETTG